MSAPILLVEDDEALRQQLRELLETEGYNVVDVGDGRSALSYLRSPDGGECSLVVLDISLPIMNGWELLSKMRGEDDLRETPVIILSARPVAEVVGSPPVFRKPLEPGPFLQAVRRHRRSDSHDSLG
jgi:DNA-binding response OmpR family regulator